MSIENQFEKDSYLIKKEKQPIHAMYCDNKIEIKKKVLYIYYLIYNTQTVDKAVLGFASQSHVSFINLIAYKIEILSAPFFHNVIKIRKTEYFKQV